MKCLAKYCKPCGKVMSHKPHDNSLFLLHFVYIQGNFNTTKQCIRIQGSTAIVTRQVIKLAGVRGTSGRTPSVPVSR